MNKRIRNKATGPFLLFFSIFFFFADVPKISMENDSIFPGCHVYSLGQCLFVIPEILCISTQGCVVGVHNIFMHQPHFIICNHQQCTAEKKKVSGQGLASSKAKRQAQDDKTLAPWDSNPHTSHPGAGV